MRVVDPASCGWIADCNVSGPMRLVALLLLVRLVATAHADGADEDKSPALALGLSLGGTVASAAALGLAYSEPSHRSELLVAGAAGLALAPSAGHWYAHDYLSNGLLIRAGSLAGAAILWSVLPCHRGDSPSAPCTDLGQQSYALALGAAGFTVGVVWDVVSAPDAATRYNERRARLVPVVTRSGYGMALAGRF